MLKLLSDAERDGDQILAVIRGSAVSQDGRSQGLTAPSLGAQVEVIEAALGRAGLPPEAIDVIETHGTGTPLGDPIEVEALARALGAEGPTIPLGAVKTNIGHLEAAAGVAGTLKLVLSLMHEQLPPNLHFHEPNPHLRLPERRFFVPTTPQPWPRAPRPRVAGQSAFGFGGTNAHLVLSEGPARSQPVLPAAALNPPLLLSAASASALSALALRYLKQLQADPGSLGVMAADAAHGRVLENAISYTFAALMPEDAEALCVTAAQETGHTFGLDHQMLCNDPMTYLPACGKHYFRRMDAHCGEHDPRPCRCGDAFQNSYLTLLDTFG
ncbi:MAG TPA: polyketide synthase, partial [Kofleriaceae bacterium]|nr:polyketide synthase [Kofleriaceae bacterium]